MITDNLTTRVYFSSILPEKCPVLNAHIIEALQKRLSVRNKRHLVPGFYAHSD